MKRLAAVLLALTLIGATSADDPAERMADPAQDARAHHLYTQLRCMICQNESVQDSHAPQAADVRRTVRERILAGDTDKQVLDYLHDRFSEYILLKPPFSPGNLALWLGPFAVLLIAGGGMVLALRGRSAPEAPLGEEEAAVLAGLLDENAPAEINAQIAPKIGRKKPASSS
ncbi:MAG: cytochrome C-type biosis protein CycL [Caulobacteraceae bacterium]|nr:cytochrome C-type biosis protein CycL [Caulobacteraceae bacterium]